MHIIQEIQQAIQWVVKQVLLIAGLFLVAAIAPIILAVLPQVLIIRNPQGDFSGLAQLFIWATPVSVAIWMAVLCHWHSIQLWRRQGKRAEWREAHGGFIHVQLVSTGYMFLGLFGSIVCEMLFIAAFKQVPYGMFGVPRFSLWFALFPFVAFAPVIFLLYKRRNYDEPLRLKADDPVWLAYLETLRVKAKEQAIRTDDDNSLKNMGIS